MREQNEKLNKNKSIKNYSGNCRAKEHNEGNEKFHRMLQQCSLVEERISELKDLILII